ncbi:ankyrin repeat domain-containing protein 7-like protein, partial [Leptotrombidium deliense]
MEITFKFTHDWVAFLDLEIILTDDPPRCLCLLAYVKQDIKLIKYIKLSLYATLLIKYLVTKTALMLATRHESPDIIKLLIESGVDVFAEDLCGGTALCYSVASGWN